MLDNLRQTIKHSFVYSLGNLATKIIGLILIPIYTNENYLTTTDYGVFGIMEVLSQLLIAMMGFAIYSGFSRWYWDKEHVNNQKSLYFTSSVAVLFISTIFIFSGSFSAKFISNIIFYTDSYTQLIITVFIASFIQANFVLPLTLMKLQSKSGLYSIVNIIKLTITLIFTIYFVVILKKGIIGIYWGQVIGGVVSFLFTLRYIFKNITLSFNKKVAVEIFNYSFPLMFTSTVATLLSAFDRFSLNYLSTLENVGIYSLGFKIANTIKVFVTSSVIMALNPIRLKKINDPNNGRFYSKVLTYFSFGLMIVALFFSMFSYEIIDIFATSNFYLPASKIVPIIALGLFFSMMKNNVNIGLIIEKKTKILGALVVVTALVNLGLNILMIPLWGIIGAAIATLLSQVLYFALVYYFAQKTFWIPYELKKISTILLTGISLYTISLFTMTPYLLINSIIKLFLIATFPFILFLFNFYEKREIYAIQGFWKKWHNPASWKNNLKKL